MIKKIGIILFLLLSAQYGGRPQGAAPTGLAFAQTTQTECPPECVIDSMEIITYYPSPYGYYEELRGDKIIVGDSDISYIDETDLPPKGTITFSPMLDDPVSSDGRLYEGSLYYQKGIGGTKGKFRLYDGSDWQDLGGGGVPPTAVMFFNSASCPSGWTPLTAAQGRYLVGLPPSGTLAGSAGTALSNLENRATGVHGHQVSDPGHAHKISTTVTNSWTLSPNSYLKPNIAGTLEELSLATTGLTVVDSVGISGTNAPYIQLLVCQKD